MWQPHWPGDPHHGLKARFLFFCLYPDLEYGGAGQAFCICCMSEWFVCEVKYILLWTHGCSLLSFSNVFETNFPGLQFIFRLIRRRVSWIIEQANAKSGGICVCHSCYRHSVGGPRIWVNILQCTWKKWSVSCSVVSDPLRPQGLQPSRLLCPWDSPGRNTGVGCHFLLQGIFWTQEWNPCLLH